MRCRVLNSVAVTMTFWSSPATCKPQRRLRTEAIAHGREKLPYTVPQSGVPLNLALPQYQDFPARFLECRRMLRVAGGIAFQLRQPVAAVGLREAGDLAGGIGMLAPKTTMNENHLCPARKDQVWPARRVLPVQAVSDYRDKLLSFDYRSHPWSVSC